MPLQAKQSFFVEDKTQFGGSGRQEGVERKGKNARRICRLIFCMIFIFCIPSE